MSMKWLLFLSLLKYMIFQIDKLNKFDIIVKAKNNYGYDLTNPEDDFFHDICLNFRYIKKDITLDYRRAYYFFPNNKISSSSKTTGIITFQRPIRNNSNECFDTNYPFNKLYTNIVFLCFIPIFFIQFTLLIVVLFLKIKDSMENTPLKKLNDEKGIKNKKVFVDNNNNITYKQFISEIYQNNTNNRLETIKEDEIIPKNEKNMDLSEQKLNRQNQDININILKENSSDPFFKENQIENGEKDSDQNEVPSLAVEKSKDNYTFGVQYDKGFKFSSSASIEEDKKNENENIPEKKEDKMKRIQYVYEQINPNLKKINRKVNNDINADTPITFGTRKKIEKFYVREEYFYFGYLLARMEDKRTLFQIYIDLLEQCQLFFKFLYSPFNIYEDRKLQVLYYLIKINIYFFVNCILIKSSVINDIYDNRNHFIDDLKRSLIATIITYAISSVLYCFTNIKRLLIRRRYKLMNLKISECEYRLNLEINKFTMDFCLSFFFNKLLILLFIFSIIFFYSSYVCFSFCNVYYYTQFVLAKCVLLSILISQNTPIVACWIPAYLRRLALKKKKANLYEFCKVLELLFIPW